MTTLNKQAEQKARFFYVLFILLIGIIGANIFTACSGEDGADGIDGITPECIDGTWHNGDEDTRKSCVATCQTCTAGSSSSVTPASSSSGGCVMNAVGECVDGSSSSTTTQSSSSEELCGGEPLPATHVCVEGVAYPKCGTGHYIPATEFCFNNTKYTKCGGEEYDPTTHFCFADEKVRLCGGEKYNPPTQFCDYDRTPEQIYGYKLIGTQVWMTENLNYYNSAWTKNNVTGEVDVDDKGSWCYNNDDANCIAKGRYYTWKAALEACPTGWHLPETDEFYLLVAETGATIDGNGNIGTGAAVQLKATTGWSSNNNGTNETGFSALSTGWRQPWGPFIDHSSLMWSKTDIPTSDNMAEAMTINESGDSMGIGGESYARALSVRCVTNSNYTPPK